ADIADWGMGWDNTGPHTVRPIAAEYPTSGIYNAATTYHFVAIFEGGVEMHVANTGNEGFRMGTKWIGENGHWIWVDRDGFESEPKRLLQEKIGANEVHLFRSPGHWREFLDCVKTRQPTLAPAETAHRSASIGHLGQIAMLLSRTIHWDPETEQILNDPGATSMLSTAMRSPWHI
ncbi:MAG: gfo/Idh/MocA family oxidoreductase, partial [Armatimonadota bacterium]|nr:gfo/Idh/MocA family oxidoreductase [Armatimonadota bacterium]